MTERDPSTLSAGDLSDPSIEAAELARIAPARPDLWAQILVHPNCYPGLDGWIRQ
ncbi:variant leucine-rich repeat-containing protein, partial [Leucobacter sp. M11]|uniref:variant leucine-rich repeat-containing protein n=1 Tax=Leucobacter sp. M11 TaxID=2993565 RepID=UPI003FA55A92